MGEEYRVRQGCWVNIFHCLLHLLPTLHPSTSLACEDYISGPQLPSFQMGLTNGEHQQDIRGWGEPGVFIPQLPSLPIPLVG